MGYKEFKLDIPSIKDFKLKIIFVVHFTLFCWATLYGWHPQSYLVQLYIFLFLLIWTIIQPVGEDHVFLCLAVDVVCIMLDIIIISIYFPSHLKSTTAEFSGVLAIFNLIFRLYSSYVLYMEWCSRTGSGGVGVTVVDAPKGFGEGGSVRSGSVLAHYPGNPSSPHLHPSDTSGIPASFTVVN